MEPLSNCSTSKISMLDGPTRRSKRSTMLDGCWVNGGIFYMGVNIKENLIKTGARIRKTRKSNRKEGSEEEPYLWNLVFLFILYLTLGT